MPMIQIFPLSAGLGATFVLGGLMTINAQDTGSAPAETATRNLWNEAFIKQRTEKKNAAASKPVIKRTEAVLAHGKLVNGLSDSFVGVTLWRMRRSRASDPVRFRGLVHPDDIGDTEEWTPERVTTDTVIQPEQLFRLSVESARRGYLYVIDRDVYPRGAMSSPSVIFPTKRLRGGDNRVEPGVPVEIPDSDDKPPVFQLKKTRPDQDAVLVTVIVTSKPIPGLAVGDVHLLTNGQILGWEKEWGSRVEKLEDRTNAGNPYSPAEQAAARDGSRSLNEADPVPLTLFHRDAQEGDPMLVSLRIVLGATGTR